MPFIADQDYSIEAINTTLHNQSGFDLYRVLVIMNWLLRFTVSYLE